MKENKKTTTPQAKDPLKQKQEGYGITTIVVLCTLTLITILIYAFYGKLIGEKSVFYKPYKHEFIRKLIYKIPAVLKTIQIFTIAWLLSLGLRALLKVSLARSKRGITVVKLLNSFIKYLIAIIALLVILSAWGVDTKTIIASAGILSLVIGLGAQSLISDIIAGFFIVFENEFQVGDIVIIDGWRGTVDEIGIRSTKIIDWQGNIKILNNSEIATVINQSKELSITTCIVGIGYKESITKVELVIKDNLERIKKNIPEIVDGPYYKGVDKLDSSSVNLLFVATVKESDYYVVQRAMNREIKMIFDENGIGIPYPQITVNPADEPADLSISKHEAKEADKFMSEQIEASKTMENINGK